MINRLSMIQTKEMLCTVCDHVIREKERLTRLDGSIGDGDHGIGMSRGMMNAKVALADSDPDTINDLFYLMGRFLLSTMGGSSGVIFGTMFMGAVTGMDKKTELDCQTFTLMMRRALEAVKEKGRAHPGEKTMVDALEPAVLAMESLETDDFTFLFKSAAMAATQGAESTRDMISKHGHSKTLGARALGHPDPGAVSVAVILRAMTDYLDQLKQVKSQEELHDPQER